MKGEGTIVWKIEDDDGIMHSIKIKKALYVPEAPSFLLAPQQWEQQQKRYHRTIPSDPSINVTRIRSLTYSSTYRVFVTAHKQDQKREDTEHVCYSNVVSDDEEKDEDPKQRHTPRGHIPLFKPVSRDGNLCTTTVREENVHDLASPGTQLSTQPPANVILTIIEEENLSSDSPQAELLRWY